MDIVCILVGWPDGYKGIYIVISDMVPTHGKYSSDHSKKKSSP